MTRKSSLEKLIDEAERFAAGCSRSRLELRLVDAIHLSRRETADLQVEVANLRARLEDAKREDIRGELAYTVFKTAPKPIPLNTDESQYIADQILAKFNVTRKNNDQ